MKLYVINHEFLYEMEALCRLFFPFEKSKTIEEKPNCDVLDADDSIVVYTEISNKIEIAIKFYDKTQVKSFEFSGDKGSKDTELILLQETFYMLCDFTGIRPPWGILTGVRPIKLARRVLAEQKDIDKAKAIFRNNFLVSEKKINLAFQTLQAEQKILSLSKPESYSLYVSIPFCPSRCSYCSFVSQSIEKAYKTFPEYFRLLLDEIEYTSKIAKKLNLRLETVYIGGGTPTILEGEQIEKLLGTINRCFEMSTVREFTFEAGRPDTITEEKLHAIKNSVDENILRISINPQTMNDEVLKAIGRKHTADDTRRAFELANMLGFRNVNTDLIAGLPKDSLDSFQSSVEELLAFKPASITVHTLALKKSSEFSQNLAQTDFERYDIASKMLDFSYDRLEVEGYVPYYLYRQSKMVGNLENTGFAKAGFEGLYNAYIMDETHTILACGAGAVTKLQKYGSNYLERIFNFKYSYEYISDYERLIEKKKGVEKFYEDFSKQTKQVIT